MAENKMEQVAKMFGAEMNKSFKVRISKGNMYEVQIHSDGLLAFDDVYYKWVSVNEILMDLLIGEAEIVEV